MKQLSRQKSIKDKIYDVIDDRGSDLSENEILHEEENNFDSTEKDFFGQTMQSKGNL